MTKKYLMSARARLSRRGAMQAIGSLLGTVAFGCGDNASGEGSTGTGDSSTGDGSTGGEVPTTGEVPGSSSGELPTTSGGTGDGTSSGGDDTTGEGTSTGDDTTGEGTSTGEPVDECVGGPELTPEELLAGIDHIVVLMMENRSFDHYLGSLKVAEGNTGVNGLTGAESNPDPNLVPVPVFVSDNFEPLDPPHEWDQCHLAFNLGENNGFFNEMEKKHPGSGALAMGYHVREHLPVTYGLADNFSVCQRWHASVMGPTWPNRYYLHSATSGGGKTNFPNPFLKTLWHRCDDAGITSKIYFGDVPWVTGAFPLVPTVWGKLADGGGFNFATLTNPNTLSRFFDDVEAGLLPNFTVIDPGFTSNDDHPSHNIQLGQILIGAIYKALADAPTWGKTLLIITYDEHGGFYDHVAPPKTIDGDPEFEQLGFRVPSIVIGPTVRRGCVNDLQFEHVSIGKTLQVRFGIAPLNDRMNQANDVSSCIHPGYINDPQPGPPVPLVTVSISQILADVGHTTSQPELFAAAGVTLDEDFRKKVQADTLRLLLKAEKLGVARLRP